MSPIMQLGPGSPYYYSSKPRIRKWMKRRTSKYRRRDAKKKLQDADPHNRWYGYFY